MDIHCSIQCRCNFQIDLQNKLMMLHLKYQYHPFSIDKSIQFQYWQIKQRCFLNKMLYFQEQK